MIDPGLNGKVALITGGNNPHGIGAAIARQLALQGVKVFIHYFRQEVDGTGENPKVQNEQETGLKFFMKQQGKTAEAVALSIQKSGGESESWEGDLREPETVQHLFEEAIRAFRQVDILVNNAAEYEADTFMPMNDLKKETGLWKDGPAISMINERSFYRHFSVNTLSAAVLMNIFAQHIINRKEKWGRIINISADCAWGCPQEISYRASKYALESYSRSAAAELGPYGITVNIISPGPVQSGYISKELEESLIIEIPLRRIGQPEDIANAAVFLASQQACWITGQLLFVHGGHRMALGR